MSLPQLAEDLEAALRQLDRVRVGAICEELAELAEFDGEPIPVHTARALLGGLRARRYFWELCRLGEAFDAAGISDARVRRLHAQGLIEEGRFGQALKFLGEIIEDPETPSGELAEARGLIGRIHKQRYVADPAKREELLWEAVKQYRAVFDDDPEQLWHGVNVVALLARAERDGLGLRSHVDYRTLARGIIELVEGRIQDRTDSLWDLASAMEAWIALDDEDNAVAYAERYVQRATKDGADQFEYGSTLRQLREVWGATSEDFIGRRIVPMLELVQVAVALDAPGGGTEVHPESIDYVDSDEGRMQFEKIFGDSRYFHVEWFDLMSARMYLIGKVRSAFGQSMGTGFLLRGPTLCEQLQDQWYFLTNSHVISDDEAVREAAEPGKRPLLPSEASVTFERRLRKVDLRRVVWTSPPDALDATLLELDRPFSEEEEEKVRPFPINEDLPGLTSDESRPRMYIIGHPNGRELAVSIHDNYLIDFDDERLQYRTPTNPGSSGSPVFDGQWRLVGLHSAGDERLKGLRDAGGTIEANEGVRIGAILAAVRRYFSELAGPSVELQGAD